MKAELKSVDLKKIDDAIKLGAPITINTYTFSHDIQVTVEQILTYFLAKLGQSHLKDYAMYCLNELAVNAKRANTKRIYFKEHGLDIFDGSQYKIGMERFKKETLENIDYYIEQQKKAGLYIKIILRTRDNNFEIEIRNNAIMTKEELLRANNKIALASQMSDFSQAITTVVDETEGAGLGLIIMTLMLKQIGATPKAYFIGVIKDETVSKISLPFNPDYSKTVSELFQTLIKQINQIPQFPDKILELQKLINDPDVDMSVVAKKISDDVGITTDLLKLVNSAAFGLKAKCSSIPKAVQLVGIRCIQNLLYSIGTMNVFAESQANDEQKVLWDHAYKVAYFSYNLARVLKLQSILDDAYVCGLLHDIGKLVFSGLYPDILNSMYRLQKERNIPKPIIDAITSGMHHAEIGAKLTEKWHFPKQITMAILYHHNINAAPKEYSAIAATIALANYMVHYWGNVLTFDQIPPEVLHAFNIKNEQVLKQLATNFAKSFEEQGE